MQGAYLISYQPDRIDLMTNTKRLIHGQYFAHTYVILKKITQQDIIKFLYF